MDNEKIVITADECDRVTPVPSCSAPLIVDVPEEPSGRHSGLKGVFLAVVITSFVFLTAGMTAYCLFIGRQPKDVYSNPPVQQSQPETAAQCKEKMVQNLNAELENPDCNVRKFIEDAHLTVKVSKAYVMSCDIKTLDGSDSAGVDGSNVQELDFTVRFFWEGMVDDGHTDAEFVIDIKAGKVLKAEIKESTALVNVTGSDFWYNVGLGFGALLAL